MNKQKRGRVRALAVVATIALAGCTEVWQSCEPGPVGDPGLEDVGLSAPKPLPMDLARIDVPAVAAHYAGPTRFVAAVLQQDYAGARRYLDEIDAMADASERMREVYRLKFALESRGMYLLSAAQQWLSAEPQSPQARLLLGMSLANGARQARGGQYSSKTPPVQMARFRQRFEQARTQLEPLARGTGATAALAHAALELPYFFAGESENGWRGIEALIEQAPQYGWLYFWATEYATPKWAGEAGPDRLQRLVDLAQRHRLNDLDRRVLDQEVDFVRRDMENNGNPQAWRPYWERRVAEAPHLRNIVLWLGHEQSVGNWPLVEQLATQAIALNPQQTFSFYWRGVARKEMGRPAEAWSDTLAAAVLGSDSAMDNLVYAHLQGTLGAKPGDAEALLAYCKMGAAFGLPAAANCLASSYTDGFAGVARNDREAARWHLLAARGGNRNSQHDLGVLLPRVQPGPAAQEAAHHWMREAARQEHAYALKKAAPEGEPRGQGPMCVAQDVLWVLLERLVSR